MTTIAERVTDKWRAQWHRAKISMGAVAEMQMVTVQVEVDCGRLFRRSGSHFDAHQLPRPPSVVGDGYSLPRRTPSCLARASIIMATVVAQDDRGNLPHLNGFRVVTYQGWLVPISGSIVLHDIYLTTLHRQQMLQREQRSNVLTPRTRTLIELRFMAIWEMLSLPSLMPPDRPSELRREELLYELCRLAFFCYNHVWL